VTDEQLIQLMAAAVRAGCARMTADQLGALAASVAQAESLPARPWWERRAVAHAETIGLLGTMTGDPALTRVAGLAAGWTYDLAMAAGVAADAIILASRRRLLRDLRASDADAAGREIERHLRALSFMARLSAGDGRGKVIARVS
jgi:DNA-binding GntR family transcriptional regulator